MILPPMLLRHIKNICFLALLFVNKDDDIKVDIRQCPRSVKDFTTYDREESKCQELCGKLLQNMKVFETSDPRQGIKS